MVNVLEKLATNKSVEGIIASVKQIPLSASSTTCLVVHVAEDVQRLDGVREAQHICLAIDEKH